MGSPRHGWRLARALCVVSTTWAACLPGATTGDAEPDGGQENDGLVAPHESREPPVSVSVSAAGERRGPRARPAGAAVYLGIRDLLRRDPRSEEETIRLRSRMSTACNDDGALKDFVEGALWSASYSTPTDRGPIKLATDTIEQVATVCLRIDPPRAFELLRRASEGLGDSYELELVRARFLAVEGRLEEALGAAEKARARGSIHALALSATIRAEIARQAHPVHRAGMLADAIESVSAEPTSAWPLIDLTAVLSTRARLLAEEAVWSEGRMQEEALDRANEALLRLSVAPFIAAIRTRSLDSLCFNETFLSLDRRGGARPAKDALGCLRAAQETRNLGARVVAGLALTDAFERERALDLEAARRQLSGFDERSTVLLVTRGDESEMLEWALALSHLLKAVRAKTERIVWLNRTDTPSVALLVEHILKTSGLTRIERVGSSTDPFTTSCLGAVMADRKVPTVCPIEKSSIQRLRALGRPSVAVLVGKDLDAELQDLAVYEHNLWLLSFRLHRVEGEKIVVLKSVSDVYAVAPPPVAVEAPAVGTKDSK
ncbi:MAG: hypothetical protein IPK13_19355 [Deltaproteobacteria bacterium]|nr:hypothetical protein [Deltaproteobacteria bacterium]